MIPVRTLHRGHKRLQPLIDLALREGWAVVRTPEGHLKFSKRGLPPIYTSATASDHRAGQNALARLRRADWTAGLRASTREAGADD
jgi:hypothetical protein